MISSTDRSGARVSTTPTRSLPIKSARMGPRAALDRCSNAAMTAVSPPRAPSARKPAARMLLPEPDGPAINNEYPRGSPPPIIRSSSGTPIRNRAPVRCATGAAVGAATGAGANTWMPAALMRKVCKPGKVCRPRIFVISIFRTTELLCRLWRSQISPSATVNTGFGSNSVRYSPIRNVVACQLVIIMPSRWMNCCRPMNDLPSA